MPSILFVCTANICRSPIATALMQRKLNKTVFPNERKWTVASAGTWARDGVPAPEISIGIMRELGLDLTVHRSRVVTAPILAESDLVLTMEQGHKEALRAEFTETSRRIYLLSEMIGFFQDIRDPYGGSEVDYQEAIREIFWFIELGFPKIIELASQFGSRSTEQQV